MKKKNLNKENFFINLSSISVSTTAPITVNRCNFLPVETKPTKKHEY